MKEYTITYAKGDIDWSEIPALKVDETNWGRSDAGIRVEFQIIWNEEGITYHGVAHEKDIVARYNTPNCDVWTDSCMEFFFRPDDKDLRYFNIECNPLGAIYLGLGTNMPDRVRFLAQNEKKLFSIKTARTADGWELYLTVPTEFIGRFFPGYKLEKGKIIYANCLKCGDDTPVRHSTSWNPYPAGSEVTFHNSEGFGKMILG